MPIPFVHVIHRYGCDANDHDWCLAAVGIGRVPFQYPAMPCSNDPGHAVFLIAVGMARVATQMRNRSDASITLIMLSLAAVGMTTTAPQMPVMPCSSAWS